VPRGDNRMFRMDRGISNDYQSCTQMIRDTRVTREGILYGASRDNDGRNPFVIVGYRIDGSGSSVGNEIYANYETCKAAL